MSAGWLPACDLARPHPSALAMNWAVGAPTFWSARTSADTRANKNVGAPLLGSWLQRAVTRPLSLPMSRHSSVKPARKGNQYERILTQGEWTIYEH